MGQKHGMFACYGPADYLGLLILLSWLAKMIRQLMFGLSQEQEDRTENCI